jgi:TolB protein
MLLGVVGFRLAARPEQGVVAVSAAPSEAQDELLALLARAGYDVQGQLALAGEAAVWQAPGRYRAFFAARKTESADIFAATVHVGADGTLSLGGAVEPLTDTPSSDETSPQLGGGWLAYATRVGELVQSVTCLSLVNGESRVFVFALPPTTVALHWEASPGEAVATRLLVRAPGPSGAQEFHASPATGKVEPPEGGLTYLPSVAGEFSWLPKLVSTVRKWPGVGPEKIALAENVFFTLVDEVTRLWHHVVPAAEVAEAPLPTTAPVVVAPSPSPVPSPTVPPLALATVAPLAAQGVVLAPSATPTPAPTPTPSPTATAVGQRLAEGIIRRAPLRPDPQRPYADVEVIEIDPTLLQVKMIPGTAEPQSTTGLVGTGVIPSADWPTLVASFNGGFAAMHGKYGMMVDRKVYLPAREGIATIAVYEDGSLRMGTWGKDLTLTPDMVSYRQNCLPLVVNGTVTAETSKLALWGLSVADTVYLYRSGLGITAEGRLIYVAGKPLSAYTLAQALRAAGAQYAMQLDVDEYHVVFLTYDVQPGKGGAPPTVSGRKLRENMRGYDGFFLRPFVLDFFYLTRRAQPLAQAVRGEGPPAATRTALPATGSAATALPGRIAYASSRDGNWELYALRPSQLEGAERLTNHPADDLNPAWSPDGQTLAFTSRRDGNAEIYTLRLADQSLRRLTQRPSEEWAPAWSPDGRRLAYQSDRFAQSDIFVSDADGRNEVILTTMQGNHESPHWSADGRAIIFDSDLDVAEAVHASINIYAMNADGSQPRRLITMGESPTWSPDGRSLAYTIQSGGRWRVFVANADGTGIRVLTTGTYDARYPAWSPDSRWLAFAGNEEGHWEIYATPAAGGAVMRLTRGSADCSYPTWGPD